MHEGSVRLTSHLNAMARGLVSAEVAGHAVTGTDVAHHVVDPDDVLGLDPLHATRLSTALGLLREREPDGWMLCLPGPGRLAGLRGPRPLNEAALAQGEVVVGLGGGIALVPYDVGPAVQWRVFRAERPFPPTGGYEAERALSETVLTAAAALTELDVAAGHRPDERGSRAPAVELAPGHPQRQYVAADRAARLLAACELALDDDGGSVSSFEADRRRRHLVELRRCAQEALCAAVSWVPATSV